MPVIKRQGTITRALVLDPAARIRQLSEHGSSVDIDKAIPIKRYFRSGSEMERQARVYYSEGEWDRAFMLYNKFATLFIEKLPKHPEYSKAPATDKSRLKKLIKQAMPRAMELKEKLKEKYEKEKEEMEKIMEEEAAAEEAKKQQEKEVIRAESRTDQSEEIAAFLGGQGGVVTISKDKVKDDLELPPPQYGPGTELPPPQPGTDPGLPPPQYMGTEQSQSQSDMEMKQEDSTEYTQSEPVSAVTSAEATSSQTEATVAGDQFTPATWPAATPADQPRPGDVGPNLTATNVALAHVLPAAAATTAPPPYSPTPSAPPPMGTPTGPPVMFPPGAMYPMAQQVPVSYNHMAMTSHTGVHHQLPPAQMTPPPAQPHPSLRQPTYESSLFQSPFTTNPPPVATPPANATPPYASPFPGYQYNQQPSWTPQATYQGGDEEEEEDERTGPPEVDRTTKPASLNALNAGTAWAGMDGYRPMYIPGDIATRFQEVAGANTLRNVETCGILAGKLSHNTLTITHIIVPKQKGMSDSCEMLNEEELFDVQDQYDLITLGWIHTHPTQTAFMSSVDLHCHCSYQIMLDEAVAIVVAPKHQQVGYFMLTEPHGLNYITHCEEEGFHVHPKEPPLYEDCKHTHHDSSMFIQIVDLR